MAEHLDYLLVVGEKREIKELGLTLEAYEDSSPTRRILSDPDPRFFGFLQPLKINNHYMILGLTPYSTDLGVDEENTTFLTRKASLDAAIRFFGDQGYKAKQINFNQQDNSLSFQKYQN